MVVSAASSIAAGPVRRGFRLQVFTADETIHLAGWEFDLISAEQPVDPPTRSREKRGEIFQFEVEQFLRAASGSTVRRAAV